MKIGNLSLIIDNELLDRYDYEGFLLHPRKPIGILVLSSTTDSTLHFYKLQPQENLFEFHIKKKLTSKDFNDYAEMDDFLEKFTNYKQNNMISFLEEHDT